MNSRVNLPDRDVQALLGRFSTSSVLSRLRQAATQADTAPHTARGPMGEAIPELRRAPRQRTYKGARIGFGNGRAMIYCLVRNLSKTGACISVESEAAIPDSINLVFDSGEASRVSRVVWRRAKLMGLAFC